MLTFHFHDGESCSESAIMTPASGDDRLRRERLVPECEPRGAELVNSAQKIKCQSHFLRCYAPRCISDNITAGAYGRHVRRHRPPPGDGPGATMVRVLHKTLLNVLKTSRWSQVTLPAENPVMTTIGRLRS